MRQRACRARLVPVAGRRPAATAGERIPRL